MKFYNFSLSDSENVLKDKFLGVGLKAGKEIIFFDILTELFSIAEREFFEAISIYDMKDFYNKEKNEKIFEIHQKYYEFYDSYFFKHRPNLFAIDKKLSFSFVASKIEYLTNKYNFTLTNFNENKDFEYLEKYYLFNLLLSKISSWNKRSLFAIYPEYFSKLNFVKIKENNIGKKVISMYRFENFLSIHQKRFCLEEEIGRLSLLKDKNSFKDFFYLDDILIILQEELSNIVE